MPRVLSRRPDLLPQAAPVFAGYVEIDRDGFSGRPQFQGMCAVLDEMGIRDPEERKLWRSLWREMSSVESEIRERQREAETAKGAGRARMEDDSED